MTRAKAMFAYMHAVACTDQGTAPVASRGALFRLADDPGTNATRPEYRVTVGEHGPAVAPSGLAVLDRRRDLLPINVLDPLLVPAHAVAGGSGANHVHLATQGPRALAQGFEQFVLA